MMKQAVILVGGKGTRLKQISANTPKPLVNIAGKTVIDHQIEVLRRQHVSQFLLLAGYGAEEFKAHFAKPDCKNLDIKIIVETEPLGTGGALLLALAELQDSFIVCYGDTIFDIDVSRIAAFHTQKNSDFTLLLHPNDHPYDSDIVEIDDAGRVTALCGYPHPVGIFLPNLVNAAFYVVNKNVLTKQDHLEKKKFDIAKDLIPHLVQSKAAVYGYKSREYIKDMGTPDRFAKVEADLLSGKVAKQALSYALPAVFLDRDGTLSVSLEYVTSPAMLSLFSDTGAAVRHLNQSHYLAVCVTNQPVIARGDCSFAELKAIQNKLETLLGDSKAYLDAVYFCPHHPDSGFSGERPEFKIVCSCRKPAPGLLKTAEQELNIDLKASWFVGDSTTDVETARRLGIKSILLTTGYAGLDSKFACLPDFTFDSLTEACAFIVKGLTSYKASLAARLPMSELSNKKMILVGGPARAGKSTFASVLHDSFKEQNIPSLRIPLDGWFLPAAQRKEGFLGSVDWPALESFIKKIKDLNENTELEIPVYDRQKRAPHRQKIKVFAQPSTIFILEGVVSLFLKETGPQVCRIRVESEEGMRQQRFMVMYLKRGYSETEAQALFQKREEDEVKLIRSQTCDVVFSENSESKG